jgi:hypothetical protein
LINEIRQEIIPIQEMKDMAPGDPRKAALAIIKVVDSDNPPIRLALGADTIEIVEGALEFIKSELDAWREVSMSTDFDEVAADKIQVVS